MPREIVPPTTDEHGEDTHPAFGLISASRMQTGPVGATLFDSDIQHRHTITVRVHEATRKRDLSHDWIHPKDRRGVLSEVEMSEAQWASFLSTMNTGNGVPCTIRRKAGDWNIPGLPHEPRLAESMAEVRNAGDKVLAEIREAFAAVEEKPTEANIRGLKVAIENATPNMEFAAKSLSEHAENVVQRSRADIEAMVTAKAQQLGLTAADLGGAPELGAGEGGE